MTNICQNDCWTYIHVINIFIFSQRESARVKSVETWAKAIWRKATSVAGRCILDPILREGEVVGGSAMVPFERAMVVSYRLVFVTIALSTRAQFAIECLRPSYQQSWVNSGQNGGSICPQHTRMAISLQRVIRSTSCLVLW